MKPVVNNFIQGFSCKRINKYSGNLNFGSLHHIIPTQFEVKIKRSYATAILLRTVIRTNKKTIFNVMKNRTTLGLHLLAHVINFLNKTFLVSCLLTIFLYTNATIAHKTHYYLTKI